MNDAAEEDHIKRFNSVIDECQIFCSITRDSGLQRVACANLETLLNDCGDLKSEAIASGNEDFANLLLGFECIATCLLSEIKMWLLLKAEEPDAAWDRLITAPMAATAAVRAHNGFAHLGKYAEHLEMVEKVVFPPQVFISSGLIVRHQECSICGSEYGECEHLAGKPYWGQFCSIVAKDIEANHVAIVENPADKRCRIVHYTADGGERNRMTWKIEPTKPGNRDDASRPAIHDATGK